MALPISPPYPPVTGSVQAVEAEYPKDGVKEYRQTLSNTSSASLQRRLPIGAEVLADGEVHFRVWAPRSREVEIVIDDPAREPAVIPLNAEPNGYFSMRTARAKTGDRYRYRLNRSELLVPDPASRFQPEGPLGPSMIIDPARFLWHDTDWKGVKIEGQVIYEMHIGTFTAEGHMEGRGPTA